MVFDYGSISGGTFTPNANIGAGGTTRFSTPRAANGNWGNVGSETLQNPLPANTYIRAILYLDNGKNVPQGSPAYMAIP